MNSSTASIYRCAQTFAVSYNHAPPQRTAAGSGAQFSPGLPEGCHRAVGSLAAPRGRTASTSPKNSPGRQGELDEDLSTFFLIFAELKTKYLGKLYTTKFRGKITTEILGFRILVKNLLPCPNLGRAAERLMMGFIQPGQNLGTRDPKESSQLPTKL